MKKEVFISFKDDLATALEYIVENTHFKITFRVLVELHKL